MKSFFAVPTSGFFVDGRRSITTQAADHQKSQSLDTSNGIGINLIDIRRNTLRRGMLCKKSFGMDRVSKIECLQEIIAEMSETGDTTRLGARAVKKSVRKNRRWA